MKNLIHFLSGSMLIFWFILILSFSQLPLSFTGDIESQRHLAELIAMVIILGSLFIGTNNNNEIEL